MKIRPLKQCWLPLILVSAFIPGAFAQYRGVDTTYRQSQGTILGVTALPSPMSLATPATAAGGSTNPYAHIVVGPPPVSLPAYPSTDAKAILPAVGPDPAAFQVQQAATYGAAHAPSFLPPAAASVPPPGAEVVPPGEVAAVLAQPVLAETDDVFVDSGWWQWSPWEVSFEIGSNGSEGNTKTFNLWAGADATFETDLRKITLDIDYKRETQDSASIGNRFFGDGRHEWFLGDSPWTIFLHGTYELDQFQAFDSRVTGDGGVGYSFISTELTELKGRVGLGTSREFGGPEDTWLFEGVFGFDFERQLSKRQKLVLTTEYFPEWQDFDNYRVVSKADWEMLIDQESGLSLKLGVVNRYDSTPNGAKPNNLDYRAVLVWHL